MGDMCDTALILAFSLAGTIVEIEETAQQLRILFKAVFHCRPIPEITKSLNPSPLSCRQGFRTPFVSGCSGFRLGFDVCFQRLESSEGLGFRV